MFLLENANFSRASKKPMYQERFKRGCGKRTETTNTGKKGEKTPWDIPGDYQEHRETQQLRVLRQRIQACCNTKFNCLRTNSKTYSTEI